MNERYIVSSARDLKVQFTREIGEGAITIVFQPNAERYSAFAVGQCYEVEFDTDGHPTEFKRAPRVC